MKIIKFKKKAPGFFPYTEYKSGKMTARVFEDLGGDLVADLKDFYYVQENGTLNDWIRDIESKLKNYQKVHDFLLKIDKDIENK